MTCSRWCQTTTRPPAWSSSTTSLTLWHPRRFCWPCTLILRHRSGLQDTLVQVLLETMDLTRIRAVGPGALGELGQYLPATYFTCNAQNDTISTDFLLANA